MFGCCCDSGIPEHAPCTDTWPTDWAGASWGPFTDSTGAYCSWVGSYPNHTPLWSDGSTSQTYTASNTRTFHGYSPSNWYTFSCQADRLYYTTSAERSGTANYNISGTIEFTLYADGVGIWTIKFNISTSSVGFTSAYFYKSYAPVSNSATITIVKTVNLFCTRPEVPDPNPVTVNAYMEGTVLFV